MGTTRVAIHKSTELDGMCLRVLREPADVFERLFSVVFGRLWEGECTRCNKVTGNSQLGFTTGKSVLTNSILAFCDKNGCLHG